MILSRNRKNNVYPIKPQFYCIKVGLRVSKLYRHVFVMKKAGDKCRLKFGTERVNELTNMFGHDTTQLDMETPLNDSILS